MESRGGVPSPEPALEEPIAPPAASSSSSSSSTSSSSSSSSSKSAAGGARFARGRLRLARMGRWLGPRPRDRPGPRPRGRVPPRPPVLPGPFAIPPGPSPGTAGGRAHDGGATSRLRLARDRLASPVAPAPRASSTGLFPSIPRATTREPSIDLDRPRRPRRPRRFRRFLREPASPPLRVGLAARTKPRRRRRPSPAAVPSSDADDDDDDGRGVSPIDRDARSLGSARPDVSRLGFRL